MASADSWDQNTVFNENSTSTTSADSEAIIKNIIVLVPYGCSQSVQTLARWYSGVTPSA